MINTLSTYNNNEKIKILKDLIIKHEVDIIGVSETNKYWHKVPFTNRPYQHIQKWFENVYTKIAFNYADTPEKIYQSGGEIQISLSSLIGYTQNVERISLG